MLHYKYLFHLAIVCCMITGESSGQNSYYVTNRAPLAQTAYVHLPLGSVKPTGWLRNQLQAQADGLSGYVYSAFQNGGGNSYSISNFYEGLVPLAFVLDDARLKTIAKKGVDLMLSRPFISFNLEGPAPWDFTWPEEYRYGVRYLSEYYEATGDRRIIDWMKGYYDFNKDTVATTNFKNCCERGNRIFENLIGLYWLYNRVGDSVAVGQIGANFSGVMGIFRTNWQNFPSSPQLSNHGVDLAQVIKAPALYDQQFPDASNKAAVLRGIAQLDSGWGQVGGRFTAHEYIGAIGRGREPTNGTELCCVMEYAYSMERLFEIYGDVAFADRLESLCFNAMPGTMTPDFWAHQYDQQANQILVNRTKRVFDNNADANCYGYVPNFCCCLSNMHQGWPRYVENMWMATQDNGLVAVAYGPSVVRARVGGGDSITITETTEYPYDGHIAFKISTGNTANFPLRLRIPSWAVGAHYTAGSAQVAVQPGTIVVVNRSWSNGDSLVLDLPMPVRTETRFNKSVSILRGPLYFSLRIGQAYTAYEQPAGIYPVQSWEISPTTPWNYGLVVDRANPGSTITVTRNPVSAVPFAQMNEPVFRKTSPDPNPQWTRITWQQPEPVILKAKAKVIPSWTGLVENSAPNAPLSPVVQPGPVVDVELIPYGSTRLRISEFPVIDTVFSAVNTSLPVTPDPAVSAPSLRVVHRGMAVVFIAVVPFDNAQLSVFRINGTCVRQVSLTKGKNSVVIPGMANNSYILRISSPNRTWLLQVGEIK